MGSSESFTHLVARVCVFIHIIYFLSEIISHIKKPLPKQLQSRNVEVLVAHKQFPSCSFGWCRPVELVCRNAQVDMEALRCSCCQHGCVCLWSPGDSPALATNACSVPKNLVLGVQYEEWMSVVLHFSWCCSRQHMTAQCHESYLHIHVSDLLTGDKYL